jgi:nicotinamide-nucleotide amidase
VNAAAVAAIVRELASRGETLAVAESLTGGLVSSTLIDVSGVSAVLRGGVVAYATDLKASLVGVPSQLLAERGPVDPDVALALAGGVRERCGADWGIATTGVAGPDEQGGMPVGTVFVAVVGAGHDEVRRLVLDGDRMAIRAGAVAAVLDLLACCLGA